MIYCTCGGQKTCFKCDGKGWIDEPEAGTEDARIVFPPVLKEYSRMPEHRTEKFDAGRKKPLIAQVKGGFSIPRSSSNMEAARLKARKLAKAAKKAEATEKLGECKRPTVGQAKAAKPPSARRISRKPAISFLSDEQRSQLVGHEKKLAKLMEVLPSAGEVTAKVELRIEEEKRAIRKLHIKANRIKRKQQLVAKIPKATA